MKERLELVTDFGALKIGMKVRVKVRGELLPFFLLKKEPVDPSKGHGECFVVLPNIAPPPMHSVLSRGHVKDRLVFRVVDGLEQNTEKHKAMTA